MNKLFLLTISILSVHIGFSQNNIGNNWYFGNRCGVSFNSGFPVALDDGILNQQEGVSTISDQNGDLLFYSDGKTIWDSQHQPMPNADGDLDGHFSSTQSSTIAPNPADNMKYYIFTIDELGGSNGLKYSSVDMSLSGNGTNINPLGNVTSLEKNIPLVSPISEKITIVLKSNNIDYWVIVHGWGNNRFYIFEVTESGIDVTPTMIEIGDYHSGAVTNAVGYMKSSISGNKIALVNRTTNHVNLFDFNKDSGVISNPINITPFSALLDGLEFSPNEEYLFIGGETTISKYNLINETHTNLTFDDNSIFSQPYSAVRALQIGPNGNIYVSVRYNEYLSMIDPSYSFVRSNELLLDIDNSDRSCRFGLPDIFFYKDFEFFTGSEIDISICQGDSISLGNTYQYTSGTFYDTLQTSLGWDSILNVNLTVLPISNSPIIMESSGVLSSSDELNYQWYFNGNIIDGETNQNFQPSISGNFQVSVTNSNGCLSFSDIFSNYIYIDCLGVVDGNSIIDQCGQCLLETDIDFNNCIDCAGILDGNSLIDECGQCLMVTDNNFNNCIDCAGEIDGDSVIDECGQCLMMTDSEFNDCLVNINEIKKDDINMYPNPFSNELFIKVNKEFSIEITDMKGKLIYSQNKLNGIEKVNLGHLTKGCYILKIKTDNTLNIKKIVHR